MPTRISSFVLLLYIWMILIAKQYIKRVYIIALYLFYLFIYLFIYIFIYFVNKTMEQDVN